MDFGDGFFRDCLRCTGDVGDLWEELGCLIAIGGTTAVVMTAGGLGRSISRKCLRSAKRSNSPALSVPGELMAFGTSTKPSQELPECCSTSE